MPFYVYIIQSSIDGTFYKGSTQDLIKRIINHNDGNSHYTAAKRPWTLVYVEELPSKKEMLIREQIPSSSFLKEIGGLNCIGD